MPETNFFWNPLTDNILQERDETGAVTAEYTTEPGLYGNLVGQNRGGVESQYHFDAVVLLPKILAASVAEMSGAIPFS